jgi:hypothetical protein
VVSWIYVLSTPISVSDFGAFHRQFHTDLGKVMSDYPVPKPDGKWHELKVVNNPFPEQLRALELIRDGLRGHACFVETIFNPWNVAEKMSSPEEVLRLKQDSPKALAAGYARFSEPFDRLVGQDSSPAASVQAGLLERVPEDPRPQAEACATVELSHCHGCRINQRS